MLARDHHRVLSEDDFLALPHSSEKLELVDGEVVVTPGPTWHHQTLAAGLYDTLRAWTRTVGPPWVVRFGPLDLRLAPGRIVQPDLLLLREPPPLDHRGPLDLLPALVVEITSSNADYDRLTKRLLYAEAGIGEYWVVDPAGGVEVFHGAGLRQRAWVTGLLVSPTLDGLVVEVDRLG